MEESWWSSRRRWWRGGEGSKRKSLKSLDGWAGGGECGAGTVGSDQIRSDHGMSFQSVNTSDRLGVAWGCLGAWVQGWIHSTVTVKLHGAHSTHRLLQKVSRADRSSLTQAGRLEAGWSVSGASHSSAQPRQLGTSQSSQSIQRAASLQILPPGPLIPPPPPLGQTGLTGQTGRLALRLAQAPPQSASWRVPTLHGPTKKFRTPIPDFDFSTPPEKSITIPTTLHCHHHPL